MWEVNMIIWIDGVNGIGKSHVSKKISELLTDKNCEYVDSDSYWLQFCQQESDRFFAGFMPYLNSNFIRFLRNELDKKLSEDGKMLVVSMTLAGGLCKTELMEYYDRKNVILLHVILEAEMETVMSRIDNDPIRDKNDRQNQKINASSQMQYLKGTYADAVRINTENKNPDEVAEEIMALF
jgi:shikimate kinase